MSDDVACPYCGTYQEINHDDGYGYEEDGNHEQQCYNCEKNFIFTTAIIYHYEGYKADCLNGDEHLYKPVPTAPRCYAKMRCEMCGIEREPTEDEKVTYSIPEKPNYD